VRNFLSEPTPEDIACHAPKPILLATGRSTRPYLWQPHTVPTQLFTIGDVAIISGPGEWTTMAGRRLRNAVEGVGRAHGRNLRPIFSGITNMYASYVVTPEEYQIQRYEGASTPFGPHTLPIYVDQYSRLTAALLTGQTVAPGPAIPDETDSMFTLRTGILVDTSATSFGDVLVQPVASYSRGQRVFVTYSAGNPRNNLMTGSSFFWVERLSGTTWLTAATDASWETRFVWRRTSTLLGRSEIDFTWDIPTTAVAGTYRVRHTGFSLPLIGTFRFYEGISRTFTI